MRRPLATISLALMLVVPALAWAAAPHAVVLTYHHVAEDTPPSTSITPDAFATQMDYLAEHDFNVLALDEIVARLREGRSLPPRTVALTFDDAYRSVYTEAFPQLRKRGWPFTVFVSTEYIDDGLSNYASWDELREMSAADATVGNHSRSHPHLVRRQFEEDEDQWLGRVRQQITGAQERLDAELADAARLFAYPYGEFSPEVQEIVRELDFVGLGQQSGGFGPDSDFTALPRFPLAGRSPSLDSFATKVRARPLPLRDVEPASGVLAADDEQPALRLTLGAGVPPASVNCYVGGRQASVRQTGEEPPVLEVRPEQALEPGRTKYNCTAPVSGADAWHWYSFLWMKPLSDGSWYRE
ncbi:MAG: polysaccharide deacetylase family protein [Halofilum sp. (in: g-proteobacteria)]